MKYERSSPRCETANGAAGAAALEGTRTKIENNRDDEK
jgi:hypothetical protein